jgi:hypothetical protein
MQMKQPAVSRREKPLRRRVEPLRRRWKRFAVGLAVAMEEGGARAKARPVCQYGLQEPGHLRRPVELAPASPVCLSCSSLVSSSLYMTAL